MKLQVVMKPSLSATILIFSELLNEVVVKGTFHKSGHPPHTYHYATAVSH